MGFGLLWFDDDSSKVFCHKVEEAAARYQEKFGRRANTCYVNPVTLAQNSVRLDGMKITPDPKVLPNYFLVGIASKKSR